jgi:hypothetical protein
VEPSIVVAVVTTSLWVSIGESFSPYALANPLRGHFGSGGEGEGEPSIHPYALTSESDEGEEADKGKDRVLVWKAPGGHGVVVIELCGPFDFPFTVGVVGEIDLDFLELLEAATFSSKSLSSSSENGTGEAFLLGGFLLPLPLSSGNFDLLNVAI